MVADRHGSARSGPWRTGRCRDRAAGAGGRCGRRKPCSRSTSPLSAVPDDHRPAGAALQQPDAAQDQGAHDPLAELGFLRPADRATAAAESPGPRPAPSRTPSTSAGRPDSCASSPMNEPGPWVTIGSASRSPLAALHRHGRKAGQRHRRDFAGGERCGRPPDRLCARQAGQCGQFPTPPAPETSRHVEGRSGTVEAAAWRPVCGADFPESSRCASTAGAHRVKPSMSSRKSRHDTRPA